MLGFLVDLFNGFISLLTGLLPQSPFQNITLGQGIDTALGWLNWLVPVGDMLGIFSLWLAAAVIVGVVNFIIKKSTGVIGTSSKS